MSVKLICPAPGQKISSPYGPRVRPISKQVDKILYILNWVLLVIVIYLLIDRYIDYKLAVFANSYFQELVRLGILTHIQAS